MQIPGKKRGLAALGLLGALFQLGLPEQPVREKGQELLWGPCSLRGSGSHSGAPGRLLERSHCSCA